MSKFKFTNFITFKKKIFNNNNIINLKKKKTKISLKDFNDDDIKFTKEPVFSKDFFCFMSF